MSAYFERLVSQSGLRVQPSAPPSAQTEKAAASEAGRRSSEPTLESAGADQMEIHEEWLHDAPSPASSRARPPGTTSRPSTREAEVLAEKDRTIPLPYPDRRRVVEYESTAPPQAMEPPRTLAAPSAPETGFVSVPGKSMAVRPLGVRSGDGDEPSPGGRSPDAPAEPALIEGVPAELLRVVMGWVAAGPTPVSPPPHPPARREARRTTDFPDATVAEATEPAASSLHSPAVAVPERVITMVEEHREDPATLSAPPSAAVAGSTLEPQGAGPVSVSIGSIHVRVDSPAPAAARVQSARSPPPVIPKTQDSWSSKLRRHYLLPH
jgi:hypothetical protein